MTDTIKDNVAVFNQDVAVRGSYQYTRQAPYSARVANKRLTDITEAYLRSLPDVTTVLDAGCGDGTYTAALQDRLPHIRFTGFDPAVAAIAEARKHYPHCHFAVGDILALDTFPTGRFDLVILRGVLHHLPTQHAAVVHAATVSGRVLIIEPNGNNPILKWIEKHSAYHIAHEEQSFSSRFLHALCLQSGLRVARLSFVGFVPFFFPSVPARIIHFFQPLLEKIPGLARFFGGQIVILAERR